MSDTLSDGVGFAILGTGMVAEYHRKAIEANAELGARLVAVGHYDPARFGAIADRFGVTCSDLETLLRNPAVDALCICTPSGQHAEQAQAAARAGKHVLVEKPMALTLSEADEMIAAAATAGVRLGVVLQRRAEPLFRWVHDTIAAGHLGSLTLGHVSLPYYRPQSYYEQADWRGTWALDGGGVLMNQGIHLVDLLLWLFGDPIHVQARAATLDHKIEVEDTLAATLHFNGGALATITATTTAAPGFPHRLEIFGTDGGIQIEGESLVRWERHEPGGELEGPPGGSVTVEAGAGADPRGIKPTGHIAIVQDFLHAVREDRQPLVSGAEGRRSLATVLAIYREAGLL
jgi:UDP-N-acetyl-2-amino-2-deoxyglucuronate dehydrogenase